MKASVYILLAVRDRFVYSQESDIACPGMVADVENVAKQHSKNRRGSRLSRMKLPNFRITYHIVKVERPGSIDMAGVLVLSICRHQHGFVIETYEGERRNYNFP